ncbi:MAG: zinc-binding dehydrogenase [Verrucomicrobiales bacterium]
MPYLSCGACVACRRGRTSRCASLQVIGVHCDGGMRERFAVPADLLIPADGLTEDQMAVVECLAIGAHAVRRATIEPGEVAAVVGAGPIGIGVLQFARRTGARVLAIDADPARLRYCRDALGIDAADCLDASGGEVGEALAARTGGDLPTAVFDATGSPAAMEASFRLPAASGRLVLVGLVQGRLSFDDPDFHRRELTLLSSRNATRQDFESVIAAFRAGELESDQFFTHRAAFGDEMVERFPGWAARGSGVIKALVECG